MRGFWAVYGDRRLLTVLLLGFSSGLPLALTGGTLSVWLTESGLSRTAVGLFALVGLPYALKFLWAPLVDRLPLPVLHRRFGRRRGWALLAQAALMVAILVMSGGDPRADAGGLALLALLVAFCSATQDIVVDAIRVELLDGRRQGAGAAVSVLGYRLGMLSSGAGALYLATALAWSQVYAVMAGLVVVGTVAVLLSPEPAEAAEPPGFGTGSGLGHWLRGAVVAPFADFTRRPAWLAVLLFIVLFKLGDVFSGVMALRFYLELGFSKAEIAAVTKLFGLAATIAGGFMGGALVGRMGVTRALLLCGCLQMLSNLAYLALARAGHDQGMLMLSVAVENVCGGMGTAAFVAYLSGLCTLAYTATQYALLTSLAAFARDVLASSSGWFADHLGWVHYYLFSTSLALPGLLLLLWLTRREAGVSVPAPLPAEGVS